MHFVDFESYGKHILHVYHIKIDCNFGNIAKFIGWEQIMPQGRFTSCVL